MSLTLLNHRFTSCFQFSELAASLGYDVTAVQLTSEPLIGHWRAVICGSQLFMLISTNITLAIYGSRDPNYGCFGVMLGDDISRCQAHGSQSVPHWCSSFSPRLSETFFTIGANCSALIGYVSHKDINNTTTDWHEVDLLEKLSYRNEVIFQPDVYERFVKSTFYRLLNPQLDIDSTLSEQYILTLYDAFSHTNEDRKLVKKFKRYDLAREFMSYAIQNSTRPLKVQDVADALYTSNTTLIKGCYELFGAKPMDVMKSLRLDQAHRALLTPEVQQAIGANTVISIAKHYGFNSRPHFAQSYQSVYGKTPGESICKTALM